MSARLTRLLAVGATAFAVAAPTSAHARTVDTFSRDGAAPAHHKTAGQRPRAHAAANPCGWAGERLSGRSLGQARQATLCLLNRIRRAHRLPPLSSSVRMRAAAWGHSRDMVRRRYFDHGAYIDRIMRSGYLNGARSWRLGENIAWGGGTRQTPQAVVDMWMHSAPHRANILTASFREVGV